VVRRTLVPGDFDWEVLVSKTTRTRSRRFLILGALLALLAFGLSPGTAVADPNIDASKDDALTNDVDGDTAADPGDTLRYTTVITNTGNMDATGVAFTDVLDGNTTFVPGSLKTTPIAVNDAYNVIGNVSITVPSGSGVLANDVDPDGGSVTAVVSSGNSINGGDYAVAADGSLTYNPPPGFNGNDSFTYDIQDSDANTDTGTVTLVVSGMIWFIDSANGACTPACDGRLGSPFNDLAVTANSFDVNAADAAGDNIFVADGSYSGGLTLLNNQKLVGDGSSSDLATITGLSLPTHSDSLPTFNGTDPVVTGSADAVSIGQNNTIRGLTLVSGTGTGIRGSNVGTLTASETSISGGGGMDINTGNLAVTLDALSASSSTDEGILLSSVTGAFSVVDTGGTISVNNFAAVDITGTGGGLLVSATFASLTSTSSATRGLRLSNLTGGSSFDGGNTTVTASTIDGVVLSNNGGSTFTFADLDIDNFSTNQRGIFANTSGTLNISAGDIDGGSGRGVDIDGTNLGVTLTSVTSTGGSTAGIDLNTTTGSFEVVGDGINTSVGGNASGGTISGKTGGDGTNNGIGVLLNNATGVTLRRIQLNDFQNFAIRGTTVTGFVLANSTVNGANGTSAAADEGSIAFTDLLGSADITDSVIGGGHEDNVRVVNSTSTLDRLTVDNTTINANGTSFGDNGIQVQANSSAELNVSVTGSTFTSSRGDQFESIANDSSTMDVLFTGNTVTNSHTNIVSGGGGLTFSGFDDSTVTYDISNNTIEDAVGIALNVFMGTGGTADWDGTINNNDIGDATDAGSGSEQAHGINVEAQGGGNHTTAITNNTIVEFGDRGIQMFAIDGSADLDATVTGNTISQPFGAFPQEAIYGQAGATTGDSSDLCADISSNSFVGAGGGSDDFRLRQRKSTTFKLPGYAGTPGDTAAVVSFVQGNNTGTPSGSATVDFPGTGGGFVGGGACPTPVVAEIQPNGGFVSSRPGGAQSVDSASLSASTTDTASTGAARLLGVTNMLVPGYASGGGALALALPASDGVYPASASDRLPVREVLPDDGPIAVAPASPAESGETINLTIGTLPPGKSITISFAVTVDTSLPSNVTQLCNQGIVSGSNFADELTDDPDVGGVVDPTCTDVENAPDMVMGDPFIPIPGKDDGGVTVAPGDTIVYTLTFTNVGNRNATGVVLTETVPANTTFNPALSTPGWVCVPGFSAGSTCTLAPSTSITPWRPV
jgi:uncharacterized repeat protein (TIGR01451 family)